jgi:putative hydrolase
MQGVEAMIPVNQDVAGRLEEAARLLHDQGADRYRVGAYLRAASSVRSMQTPVDALLRDHGLDGLKQLPNVGESIARAIRELVTHGRLPMLDRLRGEADPVALLTSVPGIGRVLANRLHEELGIETLADLEAAAHDGRLATVAGFGPKRLAGIRDSLAHRLGRVRGPIVPGKPPNVAELLDVDREYREKSSAGELQRIAPRRFNPTREAWLPILHTRRGNRRYTALFSNTARAHRTGHARDWVVLYGDNGSGEHRHTVITATYGPLRGRRVVAGREDECRAVYMRVLARSKPVASSRRGSAAHGLLSASDDATISKSPAPAYSGRWWQQECSPSVKASIGGTSHDPRCGWLLT